MYAQLCAKIYAQRCVILEANSCRIPTDAGQHRPEGPRGIPERPGSSQHHHFVWGDDHCSGRFGLSIRTLGVARPARPRMATIKRSDAGLPLVDPVNGFPQGKPLSFS